MLFMLRFVTHCRLHNCSLLALLLALKGLELIDLLQLGDLEGSVGLTGLHLQVVDLHVPLLHLELFVELLDESSQVILAHGSHIRQRSNLGEYGFRDAHDDEIATLQRYARLLRCSAERCNLESGIQTTRDSLNSHS